MTQEDNSRLGRNYPELGRLMEDYFPLRGVRVISVLNNLDSVKDPRGYCSAIVSFSNIVNDDYIRQLSIKIKCTLAMKRERGEFTGNYAPFGYQKDPNDRHRLVIDAEQAGIVRKIFDWYEDGLSAGAIAKQLNAMRVPTPAEFKARAGCGSFLAPDGRGAKNRVWAVNTVTTILKNEVYIGNMVQGRRKSVSYRSKKTVAADESEWTVVEGTHAPVVSDEQFAIVHARMARRTRAAPRQERSYPLSGLITCAHCGRAMHRVVSQGVARYRCATRACAPERCQCPSVKEQALQTLILQAIQSQLQRLVDVQAVIDAARRQRPAACARDAYAQALLRAEKEQARLREAQFRLYDDFQCGLLQREEYLQFRQRYEDELARQKDAAGQLQRCVLQQKKAGALDDAFVACFLDSGSIRTLDRDVLNHLVQRVVFHDPKHVEVYFRFTQQTA